MPRLNKCQCELCGTEEVADEFWAEVKFSSCQYLYDDGTCDQDYSWTLCRECKLKLLRFMLGPAEKRKKAVAMKKRKKKKSKKR